MALCMSHHPNYQSQLGVLLPVVQWVILYRQPIWWMVLLLYSLLILFWTNDCQSSLLVPFVLLISWRTSTSNRAATLVNVTKSGCEVLVHHFEIVAGSFLNYSDNHLLVRFFSTNTTFMRFISFIVSILVMIISTCIAKVLNKYQYSIIQIK